MLVRNSPSVAITFLKAAMAMKPAMAEGFSLLGVAMLRQNSHDEVALRGLKALGVSKP